MFLQSEHATENLTKVRMNDYERTWRKAPSSESVLTQRDSLAFIGYRADRKRRNYLRTYRWCEDSREYTWADECWLGTRTDPRRYCSLARFADASCPGIGTSPCTLDHRCTSGAPPWADSPFPHCPVYVPTTPVNRLLQSFQN